MKDNVKERLEELLKQKAELERERKEYNFQKIVTLDKPWGSTFVNDNQILLTEVSGKIKLVNLNLNQQYLNIKF